VAKVEKGRPEIKGGPVDRPVPLVSINLQGEAVQQMAELPESVLRFRIMGSGKKCLPEGVIEFRWIEFWVEIHSWYRSDRERLVIRIGQALPP
jgi:hypothetical protein